VGISTCAQAPAFTPYFTSKGQQCPAGHAIDDKTECASQASVLVSTFGGEKTSRNRPFGCFLAGNKVYYNPTPVSKRKVWKGSKGICKGGDDFKATLAYKEATKKGRNCDEGDIVDVEDDCKAAANELGKSFKKSVTSKTRPAGCYFKGNKVWFNTITTVYAKGRYGKFTGVCMAE
jgi:hypothetical protein